MPAAPAAARVPARVAGWRAARLVLMLPARVRHGRPWRLLLRALVAVLFALVTARSGAGGPAVAGVITGLAVWLALTMRGDLAPPPGR